MPNFASFQHGSYVNDAGYLVLYILTEDGVRRDLVATNGKLFRYPLHQETVALGFDVDLGGRMRLSGDDPLAE